MRYLFLKNDNPSYNGFPLKEKDLGREFESRRYFVCFLPEIGSLWDTKSGRATGKSKTAVSVNASLNKICVAVHAAYRDLSAKKENVSAAEVKKLMKAKSGIGRKKENLLELFRVRNEEYAKQIDITRSGGTFKTYKAVYKQLER